jgi:hypothetical protein
MKGFDLVPQSLVPSWQQRYDMTGRKATPNLQAEILGKRDGFSFQDRNQLEKETRVAVVSGYCGFQQCFS